MPQRASHQAIAASLGKTIFRSNDAHKIEKKLKAVGEEKLKKVLSAHGAKPMDAETLAQALSGSKRSNLSEFELRKVTAALQDKQVDLARRDLAADKMVLNASREAQDGQKNQLAGLSPDQIQQRMHELTLERRAEANAEEEAKAHPEDRTGRGVLDRMRGAMGRANQANPSESAGQTERIEDLPSGSGSSIMDKTSPRKDLSLQPKLVIPRPVQPPEDGEPTFQA